MGNPLFDVERLRTEYQSLLAVVDQPEIMANVYKVDAVWGRLSGTYRVLIDVFLAMDRTHPDARAFRQLLDDFKVVSDRLWARKLELNPGLAIIERESMARVAAGSPL